MHKASGHPAEAFGYTARKLSDTALSLNKQN